MTASWAAAATAGTARTAATARTRGDGKDARDETAAQLTPAEAKAAVWTRVQLARNLRRPRILELLAVIADEFVELHGDRLFGDDEAVVAGFARIDGHRVAVDRPAEGRRHRGERPPQLRHAPPRGIPQGDADHGARGTERPPGRHVRGRARRPPGSESEERGIAEAIARSVGLMTRLRTPIVTVITGEGGSGGALAIAVGDVVLALENAVYSVISPEGCASILWRTTDEAPTAALAMKMTAADQQALGVVDLVIEEPADGAHTDHEETGRRIKVAILRELDRLAAVPVDLLVEQRYRRYRSLGAYAEIAGPAPTPPVPPRGGLADRLRGLLEAGQRAMPAPLQVGRRDEPPAREDV